MSTITVYTLFFDDIRVLALPVTADEVCWGVTVGCMFMFCVEIFLGSICKDGYFLSFFFWLDVVSTISMLPDIGWVWDLMTGGDGSESAGNAA
jgi:hypothetical protein